MLQVKDLSTIFRNVLSRSTKDDMVVDGVCTADYTERRHRDNYRAVHHSNA